MEIRVICSEPVTPPPTGIHLELTLDEAMMFQAVIGTIPCGFLKEAGNNRVDGVKVWVDLTKALMATGMPLKSMTGTNFSDTVVYKDDYKKYF